MSDLAPRAGIEPHTQSAEETNAPLMDLVLEMLDQRALISKTLSQLQKEPNSSRASLRNELRKMVAKIDRLANGLDGRAGQFSSHEGRRWLDLAERIWDELKEVKDAIDSTVNGGQVSKPAPADLKYAAHSTKGNQGGDEEQTAFERCLSRFLKSDELAQSQALSDLTGRFQGRLAAHVVRDEYQQNSETEKILQFLWQNAEVVLLADYHKPSRDLKLLPLLAMDKVSPYALRFKQLLSLFEGHEASRPILTEVLAPLDASARESLLRALLIHPNQTYRSYGISQLEPAQYWSIVSAAEVPVVALADIAGRLRHRDVSESYRKIFFDCTMRRLAKAQTEQQVTAARSVIERFASFQFALEDNYYRKMMKLNDVVEKREGQLQIDTSVSKSPIEVLKREKDRVGSRKTYYPKRVFAIPLSVQRKLAREGHYLKLFVRHPHPKIALETMRFVTSTAMAEAVLRTKETNRYLVLEICKRPALLRSYKARMALLANPHTPVQAGLNYIPFINRGDLKHLAANHDTNPEIRVCLARRLNGRASLLNKPQRPHHPHRKE